MNVSATRQRIGNLVMRTSIAVYGIVWLAGLALWLKGAWLVAVPTAAAYAAMHAYEFAKRGRCWMSADSRAVPVSAVVYIAAVAGLMQLGYAPLQQAGYVAAVAAYGGVLMIGHVVVLTYVGITENLLLKIYRRRIDAESRNGA